MLAISKPGTNKKEARSRVTNGHGLFINLGTDQRTPVARRLRDLIKLHSLDISPQGAEHLSTAQAQLIRRVAMIEVQAELMEARLVDGDTTIDVESFARIASHLRRMYKTLGLRKTKLDTAPTLDQLVARHHAAKKPADHPSRLHARAAAQVAHDAKREAAGCVEPLATANVALPIISLVPDLASRADARDDALDEEVA